MRLFQFYTQTRAFATIRYNRPTFTTDLLMKKLSYEDQKDEYKKLFYDKTITKDDPVVKSLTNGILNGDRSALARAITLVSSKHVTKRTQGNFLINEILKKEREKFLKDGEKSLIFRIAISGAPGVGKSSFIETLGDDLTNNAKLKVAVLTVDPTSAISGGSVLGDLTRMQNLSRNPMAYIRQSPTSGSLGGVTRGLHESIILCEGAGYNVVIIETVGVGQSEIAVADMCDLFCLLVAPSQGDELQGIKRGIMEQSDIVVVTKSDGALEGPSRITAAEHVSALKFMKPRTEVWKPRVLRSSVHHPETIKKVRETMFEYRDISIKTGHMIVRRDEQLLTWMWNHVKDEIVYLFQKHPDVQRVAGEIERKVRQNDVTPGFGAELLLRKFFGIE
ncbi:Methylmalonic aciduria type A protein,mitochondrial [Strongyloides ratti]|uniref:Methylmalonic aciduria type A protein,mitochondrial n=1 Tax=Strongyloides ratti TaxID=34506 RepID=A0A090KV17_STRRB|nr:Methylmalonic aciduria type A protein,mitochondrial [Strongyloides ratti]CEF61236.1 Methylmalonic aciduria type A protein,mitochondrial [Strongyloides ratti]